MQVISPIGYEQLLVEAVFLRPTALVEASSMNISGHLNNQIQNY
jgi:hypothetical protein